MKLLVISILCLSFIHSTLGQTNIMLERLGKYQGVLHIFNGKNEQKINMELQLLPTQIPYEFEYNIIYLNNDSIRDERLYTLKYDTLNETWSIDENNGIVLSAHWVNQSLYSLFEVEGGLLTSTIEFKDSYAEFQITHSSKKNALVTGGISDEIPKVISYPIGTVQKAKLFKVAF